MSAVDDRVHAELELLRNMQFEGMAPEKYLEWQEKVDQINDQYDQAQKLSSTSKYAKELGDSIAKGLPAIVKGMQAATTAFQKGDAISGSAAVMDICAAAAPIISAMCSAAGPEGMLVGALFSVIGQILSFFAPKQPSLEDKIKEMLRALNTEEQLVGLDAIRKSNAERDLRLTEIYLNLAEHTRLGLLVRADEQADFSDRGNFAGKAIIVARGSAAAANAQARYPGCTIHFIDEVAKGQNSPSDYVVTALLATHQADALYGLDMRNQSLCEKHPGFALADVHLSPGREPSILELPLLTEDDADIWEKRLEALNFGILRAQAKSDHAAFKSWEVAAWLQLEEKQDYARWSEVLGVWCRAYNEMVESNTRFNCLMDPELVHKMVRYTHEKDGACPLPPLTKARIHGLLIELQGLALNLREESAACNAVALKFLEAVTPVAQAWGLFACLGPKHDLYFTSGRANYGHWTDKSDRNYYHRLAMFPGSPPGGEPQYDFKPRPYALILKSNWSDYPSDKSWLDHVRVAQDTFDISDARQIRDNPEFQAICGADRGAGVVDCWAVPGGRDGIETWTLDKQNDFHPAGGGWHPITKAKVESVGALYPTLDTVLAEDPEGAAIPPGSGWLDPQHAAYSALIYAGLHASAEIFVRGNGGEHYVPGPGWPYTGIAVDSNFVWVFAPNGFACATHASIINWIEDPKRPAAPRWMQHRLPSGMVGRVVTDGNGHPLPPDQQQSITEFDTSGYWSIDNGQTQKPMPGIKGIVSMSPCDDGTLTAAIVYREASADRFSDGSDTKLMWNARDTYKIYTTDYTVDVARQALQVTEPWTELGGAALVTQKTPIGCWPLFASLKTRLEMY